MEFRRLGFVPVGTAAGASSFSGSLDGNNYSITGLTINRTGAATPYYVGLFGYCTGVIQNITLTNANISGTGSTGATGAVGGDVYVGGLAGYISNGLIINSSVTGTVTGTGGTGGPGTVGGAGTSGGAGMVLIQQLSAMSAP